MGSSGALKVLYKACRCCHRQTFDFDCEKLQIGTREEIKKAMIWNSIVYKPASESEVGRISVAVSDDASAVRRMGQVGIDSFKFPK